ncbi:cyclic nucleotide-binding domain-containing protein [Proteocatella sphenisci]|uniref:cyclic nucleotide-binding domain-containing protein n=1 Tax=Proteocatella sphenisci TaxID=181070 RepID=UPI00048FEB74|nr:cyclic nucleotide-binding domain-containing protein [Proteocatella sphenisci]
MRIINDDIMKDTHIKKYQIDDIFTLDIRSEMKLILYKKGEMLCTEGENLDYMLFLTQGRAKSYISLQNGKNLLICFYENFEVMGDIEILGTELTSGSIEAVEDTYCIGIPMNVVNPGLMDDSRFLRFICKSLGGKLHRSSHNSSINLLYPLESRLAGYILKTSEQREKVYFEVNLSETAQLLSTSYRHLLRTLESFCEARYLKKVGGAYEVVDEESLRKMSAEVYL